MDINKDTIVSKIGPFKTKIKLGFLLEFFCELETCDYDIDNVDEIIQDLNEEEFDEEHFSFHSSDDNTNNLVCSANANWGCEDLIILLEKVFKEEFYYMRSDEYRWDTEVENPDLKTFIKKYFVETHIVSSNKVILEVTTKDHSYHGVREINENNFLTNDEKTLLDSLSENEKVEKSFFTRYQYYYIRKKDFNIEKWWLGWSDEQ